MSEALCTVSNSFPSAKAPLIVSEGTATQSPAVGMYCVGNWPHRQRTFAEAQGPTSMHSQYKVMGAPRVLLFHNLSQGATAVSVYGGTCV
jgi:hypothetical protein